MRANLVAVSLAVLCCAAGPLAAQKKGTSICKDGTTSMVVGRGACSGHGGVDSVATKAARRSKKAAKAEEKVAKAEKSGDTAKARAAREKAGVAEKKANKAEAKAAADSTGATAQCKDGTYSHATARRGMCASHGGVAKYLKS